MTLSTTLFEPAIHVDQARELRALIAERLTVRATATHRAAIEPARTCRTLAILGSKGGVGKSVVALNLALSLARAGANVALLDASPGIGSLSLLSGQHGYWNFEHVAAGIRTLDEIVLPVNAMLRIVPGADRLCLPGLQSPAWRALDEFERRHDWLLVDTGADLDRSTRFARCADATLVVTTPEPTSVAEAYSAIKRLAARGASAVSVLVNQADSEEQGRRILDRLRHAARAFLVSDIGLAGVVPFDAAVGQSVFRRTPLSNSESPGAAQRALERIGQRLTRVVSGRRESTYVESLRATMDAENRERLVRAT